MLSEYEGSYHATCNFQPCHAERSEASSCPPSQTLRSVGAILSFNRGDGPWEWSPSATEKIYCSFCAWCISAGNAPCAKTAIDPTDSLHSGWHCEEDVRKI